jgi:hypothetical protein
MGQEMSATKEGRDLPDVTDEELRYMEAWGRKLGFTEHYVCAKHSSQHAYGYEPADVTLYTTIDGTTVFENKKPILCSPAFSDAHYGPGGGPNNLGKFERKSIVKTIRHLYFQFYQACEEAEKTVGQQPLPARPDVIETRTTYCGN